MDNLKFYILIRDGMDISAGKIAVHVGHICSNMAWSFLCQPDRADLRRKFERWFFSSQQTKILLTVDSYDELMEYRIKARMEHALITWMIGDAGFTDELKRGEVIAFGIEPIDKLAAQALGLDKLELYK